MANDRMISRDDLKKSLPDEMAAVVDHLPGCDGCDDVSIDGAVGWLMHLINSMISTQDEAWRFGAVASCKRILDREFPQ